MKNVRRLAEAGSGLLPRYAEAFSRAGRIYPLISALATGIGPALVSNPAAPAAAVIAAAPAVTASSVRNPRLQPAGTSPVPWVVVTVGFPGAVRVG